MPKCVTTPANYKLNEIRQAYVGQTIVSKTKKCAYSENQKTMLILLTGVGAVTTIAVSEGTFEQRLEYSGKTENQIRVTYKEFKDQHLRHGFTQELIYEYPKNKLIRFRNCEIEILEADKQSIKFRVLSDL